jgi:hypothetical protein
MIICSLSVFSCRRISLQLLSISCTVIRFLAGESCIARPRKVHLQGNGPVCKETAWAPIQRLWAYKETTGAAMKRAGNAVQMCAGGMVPTICRPFAGQ